MPGTGPRSGRSQGPRVLRVFSGYGFWSSLVNDWTHGPSNPLPMTAPRPAAPRTDASLVEAYRTGDESAAAELVRRHAAALGRFLYAHGAPRGEVDDLVQETFFRAFRSLGSWRGEAAFRSWLFRIGGNLRKDLFRREGGRSVVSILETDLPDAADTGGEAEASEAERRLRAGIRELPRLQREVFLLRAQEGLDYGEIAAACGTTPGAARVHYHHAVRRLKELLA
jgi:RNA polymerase sigma-70 factor, ECF subfamily